MVSPINPILKDPLPEKDATAGIERPLALLKHIPEGWEKSSSITSTTIP